MEVCWVEILREHGHDVWKPKDLEGAKEFFVLRGTYYISLEGDM